MSRTRTKSRQAPAHPRPASGQSGGAFEKLLVPLSHFWVREYSLSVFCLFAFLSILGSMPLLRSGTLGIMVHHLVFALVLISGVMAIAENRRITAVAAMFAAVSIVSQGIVTWMPSRLGSIWTTGSILVNLALLAGLMLLYTFRRGPVTFHRIQGAIGAYLLLGLAWANAYLLVELLHPDSFNLAEKAQDAPAISDFIYLSFTTLTTLGYGDSTPVGPLARSLGMTEALVGQLYPAILIGRLVSMELQSHRSQRPPA